MSYWQVRRRRDVMKGKHLLWERARERDWARERDSCSCLDCTARLHANKHCPERGTLASLCSRTESHCARPGNHSRPRSSLEQRQKQRGLKAKGTNAELSDTGAVVWEWVTGPSWLLLRSRQHLWKEGHRHPRGTRTSTQPNRYTRAFVFPCVHSELHRETLQVQS